MTEKEIAEMTLNEIKNDVEKLNNPEEYEENEIREKILKNQNEVLNLADGLEDRYSRIEEKKYQREKNIIEKDGEKEDYQLEKKEFYDGDERDKDLNTDEVVYSEKKRKNNKFLMFIIGIFAVSLLGIVLFISSPKGSKKEKINLADPNSFKLTDVDKTKEDEENSLTGVTTTENNEQAAEITTQSEDTDLLQIPPDYSNEIEIQDRNRNREIEEIDHAINETENSHPAPIIQEDETSPTPKSGNGMSFINRNKAGSNRENAETEKSNENQNENASNNSVLKRNTLNKVKSPYEIKQGSVIPAILITEINTDLPGTILAHVREDVYDSMTGNYLLIPKGSKLYGRYESNIQAGINRVLVVWDKVILTNGNHLDLLAMQGADSLGNSGFKDKKSSHILSLIGNAIFSSILNITNKVAGNTTFKIGKNVTVGLNGSVSSGNSDGSTSSPYEAATAKILEKSVDRQPTIRIRRGYKFNIIVNEDLELEALKKR